MKLMSVLQGDAISPPPVWLMRQAGRYLPEYRALRARAGDFLSLCLNPELAAEITLQPIRRFGFDAAILFSDILILPMALGQGLRFAEGEGPLLPPLQSLAELTLARAPEIYAPVLETVRRTRAALPVETTLIGFAGSPATVACYMVDGKGGWGEGAEFPRLRALAAAQDPLLQGVLDVLVEATITYLQGQIDAGANCVMLFETWAGVFDAEGFRRYVIAPNARIVQALRQKNPGLKILGFPRHAGAMLGEYVRETGVDAVGLDSQTRPADAIAACPAGTVFQGNLDPGVLRQGGEVLDAAVDAVLAGFHERPHIFNLGHGITPDVPVEHVERLMKRIRGAS
jgi:uroporphyrinogen decarboxylase